MINAAREQEQNRSKRGEVQLKEGLAKRLSSYVSAAGGARRDALGPVPSSWVVAGAAGIGVLALSVPAHANIVKGNSFSWHRASSQPGWDVAGSGVVDFLAFAESFGHEGVAYARGRLSAVNGGLLAGPLGAGYKVGPGDVFRETGANAAAVYFYASIVTQRSSWGSWANKSGYLGFVFDINGQAHYGWAYLSVDVNTVSFPVYIGEAGPVYYNTIPNEPILTGQTTAAPEPGTLGLLALGSVGLGFWRRKRPA